SGLLTVICDTDEILSAAGEGKRVVGRHLSKAMDKVLMDRRSYFADKGEGGKIFPVTEDEEGDYYAQLIIPIVSSGDCLGAVVLLSVKEGVKIETSAIKLAQLTAEMLANQFD
ncbi:MAG: hypothetical protein J6S22_02115, partial [Clostridia bacterium]|nr:hypothetical protein [Clostridia bacterium]